jgi:L-ascorbate metabolism protein UlaG (beta-lactamase superfamily)
MRLIGETYKPDLVIIPIGGHFTMGPREAAIAVRDLIKPKYAIPVHYGTFPLLAGTPAQFMAELGVASTTQVVTLEPGQKVDF